MSAADLQHLIQRATPRVEDVRSPDRTDFVRNERGHMPLREVVDALNALDFSADVFLEQMQDLGAITDGADAVATAVHGLYHALAGTQVLVPPLPEPAPPAAAPDRPPPGGGGPAAGVAEQEVPAPGDWEQVVREAREAGTEAFRRKDFAAAAQRYGEAIAAAPRGFAELHALLSNRSAALLQVGDVQTALADAERCVELAPSWPKAHFRTGCCYRQAGRLREAMQAFRQGQALEPGNKDWEKELEKTDAQRWELPASLVRQLLLHLLPELLPAFCRGRDPEGVLQLQVNAELSEMGVPKWHLLRRGRSEAKAQVRYAFCTRRDYLANLVANIKSPPCQNGVDQAAVADARGEPLRIAEVSAFLSGRGGPATAGAASEDFAAVQIDVRSRACGGKLVGIVCRIPLDRVRPFIATLKDPAAPKGMVAGVLELQRASGFSAALPRYLGFQSYPGDLNFPVIDLDRDAPPPGAAGAPAGGGGGASVG